MNNLLKQKLSALPKNSGVYVMKDISGNVIYVGKAKNLKNRVSQYFNKKTVQDGYTLKVKTMVDKICDFEYYITLSEIDALALENTLIKKHQPFFNILLKDSKTFPYIKIDMSSPFPKLEIVRRVKNDKAKYFGPYFAGIRAGELLKIINSAFEVRTCNQKINPDNPAKRECLNFSLGLCSAPCTNRISKEDYAKIIHNIIDFLNGNDKLVLKRLEEKMHIYAESQNFEKALEKREEIKMVKKLTDRLIAEVPKKEEIDVFAYATNNALGAISHVVVRAGKVVGVQNLSTIDASLSGAEVLSSYMLQYYENAIIPKYILVSHMPENANDLCDLIKKNKKVEMFLPVRGYKKRLLQMAQKNAEDHLEKSAAVDKAKFSQTFGAMHNLQSALNLKNFPKRIECYDISNTQGSHSVAAMVVAINGEMAKKHYRKFKIKTVCGPNDFLSLKEVITRRLEELEKGQDESFKEVPNLIVIDGGKGQLSVTCGVLFEKRKDVDIVGLAEKFDEVFLPNQSNPIMLKRASVELRLLQTVRNEAHRFAITFHRNLRQKNALKSPLDEIDGVGPVKKKSLIKQFKTIEGIKKASPDELALVKGIDARLAQKIYEFFQKK